MHTSITARCIYLPWEMKERWRKMENISNMKLLIKQTVLLQVFHIWVCFPPLKLLLVCRWTGFPYRPLIRQGVFVCLCQFCVFLCKCLSVVVIFRTSGLTPLLIVCGGPRGMCVCATVQASVCVCVFCFVTPSGPEACLGPTLGHSVLLLNHTSFPEPWDSTNSVT